MAQNAKNEDRCQITPTQIIELEKPDFKAPIIMESAYKLAGLQDIIAADFAHSKEEGGDVSFVVLGNYSAQNTAKKNYPFLTRMNHKGEVIWDVHENSKYEMKAVALLKNKFGYVVLGNIYQAGKGHGFYITQYDKNGKRLRRTPFYVAGYNVFAKALDFSRDGKGYLVVVERIGKEGKKVATAYRVNFDGFSPWDKRYEMEGDSLFENIQLLTEKGHIVTGSVETEDGRMAAWLFNLRALGNTGWQKEYVRGANASLHQAIPLKTGGFLLAGYSQSFFGDKKSAWVMKVGSNSVPIWQRFYTGDYDYHIQDFRMDKNGLISVLLDAQPFDKKDKKKTEKLKSHIRLLTLSPRGDLLYQDSFQGADIVYATKLLQGKTGEHAIFGMKQFLPPEHIREKLDIAPINEGWVFFVPSFTDYVDPCVAKQKS